MQVRKFEAKTMKDALELVKLHLGPEAIILSAKDNSRGFGLIGERSVEVTAAISEETLRRKKLAESKLRESSRRQYSQAPAKIQKQFIQRVHERPRELVAAAAPAPASSSQVQLSRPASYERYIDIVDEETESGQQRIRDAAHRARAASQAVLADRPRPRAAAPAVRAPVPAPQVAASGKDVMALENQIGELKTMLETIRRAPQTMVSAHPGAEEGIPFELSMAYQRLRSAGVRIEIAVEWMKAAKTEIDRESLKKPALIDAWLAQKILRDTNVTKDPSAGRYHMFLGATGQGKTSSLVKMASQLVLKEKRRIALVSLDTIKVGATDQLKIYAQILNVPFAVVRSASEWGMLEERVRDVHHILVDAPGMNLKTMEEVEWLRRLLPPAQRRIHFVQSALARDEECFEIASRYRMIGFDDVIFTRLDETLQHGLLVGFQKQYQTQLHSFGTGTRIPEDFEWATKERVVDLIFKISKLRKREVEA